MTKAQTTAEAVAENFPAQDPMAGMEEIKPMVIKWGKVGDWCRGTLSQATKGESNYGGKIEPQLMCEFIASGGSFHNLTKKEDGTIVVDEQPTIIEPGSICSLYVKGKKIDQMQRVSIGQIFGVRFTELKEAKTVGYNAAKILKFLVGPMDEHYQGQTGADVA